MRNEEFNTAIEEYFVRNTQVYIKLLLTPTPSSYYLLHFYTANGFPRSKNCNAKLLSISMEL